MSMKLDACRASLIAVIGNLETELVCNKSGIMIGSRSVCSHTRKGRELMQHPLELEACVRKRGGGVIVLNKRGTITQRDGKTNNNETGQEYIPSPD